LFRGGLNKTDRTATFRSILPAETFQHATPCFSTSVPQHSNLSVFIHLYLTLVYTEWLIMKYDGTAYTGLTDSGQGQATGCCEHGNEPSVFMKYGGFFD
jgi:hypothetical protein